MARSVLAVLLQAPDGPQQCVGLFHFVDGHADRLFVHEITQGLLGRSHVALEAVHLANRQRQAGQRDKCVAGTALEPRIACQYVFFAVLLHMELVCSVDQAVVEAVAAVQVSDFIVHDGRIHLRVFLLERSGEDNAFTFLDRHFEIAGHEQVLARIVAALALFRVVQAAIPVGLIVEFVFGRSLHIQFRVAFIQAHLDTVLHRFVPRVGHAVLVGPLAHTAECQERTQAQGGGRVGFHQGVAYEKPEPIGAVDDFLFQQDAADAINPGRNFLPFEADDVLVPFGAVILALVFV